MKVKPAIDKESVMAISNVSAGSTAAVLDPARGTASGTNRRDEVRPVSARYEDVRAESNAQILQASLTVAINAGNESQALLFRAAVEKINEILKPELGELAPQNAVQQDNSPEATAGRILSFATGLFDRYAQQYPDKNAETVVRDFVGLVRGGFEQGYKEATDILSGLNVFEGDIEAGVRKTYALVSQGFDDFLSARLEALKPAETPAQAGMPES
jgi:hypothetical protein